MPNQSLHYEDTLLRLRSALAYHCIVAPVLTKSCISAALVANESQQFNSFSSSVLVLYNLKRDIYISVAETHGIIIEDLSGNNLTISEINDQLVIQGKDSTIQALNASIEATDGTAYISTSEDNVSSSKCPSPLKISVPPYSELQVRGHTGTVATEGPMGIVMYEGTGKLNVESVRHMNLSLSGNARATVSEIVGDLNIFAAGNSKTVFHDGLIEDAVVNLKSNAKVKFPGGVDKLSLNARGNSRFEIDRAHNLKEVNIKGSARVKILQSDRTLSTNTQ